MLKYSLFLIFIIIIIIIYYLFIMVKKKENSIIYFNTDSIKDKNLITKILK